MIKLPLAVALFATLLKFSDCTYARKLGKQRFLSKYTMYRVRHLHGYNNRQSWNNRN